MILHIKLIGHHSWQHALFTRTDMIGSLLILWLGSTSILSITHPSISGSLFRLQPTRSICILHIDSTAIVISDETQHDESRNTPKWIVLLVRLLQVYKAPITLEHTLLFVTLIQEERQAVRGGISKCRVVSTRSKHLRSETYCASQSFLPSTSPADGFTIPGSS